MAQRDDPSPPGIRSWLKWSGLALLGIVVAAAVSVAAGSLSSQPIGLTSEPVSAGDQLVPRAVFRPGAGLGAGGGPRTGSRSASSPRSNPTQTSPLAPPSSSQIRAGERDLESEADD